MAKKKTGKESEGDTEPVDPKTGRPPSSTHASGTDDYDFDDFEKVDPEPESQKTTKKKASKKKASKQTARKPRTAPQDDRLAGRDHVSSEEAPRPERVTVPTASLEQRKLTKKQKAKVDKDWNSDNRGKSVDTLMQGMMDAARVKFGQGAVLAASATDSMVVCIPCPALAFEYLIAQSGFPLGLIMHLNGPPGSCKSALLFEFMRWFRMVDGVPVYNENETKYSPDLSRSIMGYGADEVGMILNRCTSVEDWQEKTMFYVEMFKRKMDGTKEAPGSGRTVPVIIGVDSIMGKASIETQEKIRKEGSAGRNYPIEALIINTWLKTIPQCIDGWPFFLVLNNHLKINKDEKGRDKKTTSGGQSVNFQESWEIQTQVVTSKLSCASWDGIRLKLRCAKNSFGPTHRTIETRMIWWDEQDKETGKWTQVTEWDWDWSTVHLLSTATGRIKANLAEAGFHIATPETSVVGATAWSKNLGMTAKEPKSWQEVGKMIRENPELMELLRGCLGIKSRPYLTGDYLEQTTQMAAKLP